MANRAKKTAVIGMVGGVVKTPLTFVGRFKPQTSFIRELFFGF